MFVLLLFFTTLVGTATSEAAADGKLSAQFYTSAMLMEAVCSTNSTVEAGYALNQSSAPHIPCAPATTPAPAVIGARWDGHLVGLTPGKNYTFGVKTTGAVRFYVHGWKLVDSFKLPSNEGSAAHTQKAKWSFPADAALQYPVRLDYAGTAGVAAQVQLLMIGSTGAWVPIPSTMISSYVSPSERQRQAMQTALATGWNTWFRPSATDHIHLPTGFGFGVGVVNKVTGSITRGGVVDRCQEEMEGQETADPLVHVREDAGAAAAAKETGNGAPRSYGCGVRPGPHSYNGSYTKLTQQLGIVNGAAVEVDTESAHLPGSGGNSMVLLLTANVTAAANLADLSVQTIGQYYFDCNQDNDKTQDGGDSSSNINSNSNSPCGTMNAASATTLVAHPVGFQSKSPLTVQILGGSATSPAARLLHHRSAGDGATLKNATFDASGRVCFLATWNAGAGAGTATAPATPLPSTVAECAIIVAAAAAASDAALHTKYGAVGTSDRDLVDAIRSVVGWNTMYDPRIKVATPVSRSFGSFPYEMWLWDTFFCTLLASEDSKELAYSNLIEIARPTVRGNVPGFRSVGEVVGDRSKPYVGAMILKAHYKKFGDKWVVEHLFDDLLLWTNWIRDQRTDHTGLVFLGTDNVPSEYSDNHQCTTTAAKWESGLDNSPMYDGIEVIKAGMGETCKYPIYDVGMTGLYMSMCDSLAELAEDVLDRPDVAADLRARLNTTATATQKLMWSEEEGMFLNRHFNGSLSKRVSPFNFHPMIAGVATVEQARRMATEWLMEDEGFCLPKKAVVVADVDAGAGADAGVGAGVPPVQSRRAAAVASNSGGGGAGVLNLYYSNRMHDNTVCVDGQCPTTVNRSAGYVHWGDKQGVRNEGQGVVAVVGAPAGAPAGATVALRNYYSAANKDNYVGVSPKDASYADLGPAGVSVYTSATSLPDNGSWSFDLYWSEDRKDMQNTANPITRDNSAGYRKVGTLGFVVPTPAVPPPPTPNPPPPPPPAPSKCVFGMPSIAHKDPAYGGEYWRGRTWGPMNALVYYGLAHPKYAQVAEVQQAKASLATVSGNLLLQEWRLHGHVHENYDPATGEGDNKPDSNPFYTWGALLSYISLEEKGLV